MTGSTGLLNFFVLEATEYVDQLDALLGAAGPAGPDAEAFTRAARALRGSATMAKLTGISALAAAVERLGRALRERALPWTPLLRGALTAAVDDLRQLVRGARNWGEAEESRAQTRTAELLGFAPLAARTASPTPVVTSSGALFVVSGCTDVASALSAAAARPGSPEPVAEALRRLRALRGVAALRDHPPLPDVLDAVERAARPVESRPGPLEPAALVVLSTAARLLRRAADELRAGRRLDVSAPEMAAFDDAVAALDRARAESSRVVPIAELYPDGDGPHVLHAAPAPATTLAERFRLEAAAAGEHLRRTVAEARAAQRALADQPPRTTPGRGVPRLTDPPVAVAARDLARLVRSFGHASLADAVAAATERLDPANGVDLAAADAIAALFVSQRRPVEELERRAAEFVGARAAATLVNVGLAPLPPRPATPRSGLAAVAGAATAAAIAPTVPPAPTPSPAPAESPEPEEEPEPLPVPTPRPEPVPEPEPEPEPELPPEPERRPEPVAASAAEERATLAAPTGRDLHALLESGIAGITRLQTESEVAAASGAPRRRSGTPDEAVPIGELLYRGRAALGRALELRDEIRREGGTPSTEQLDELFDLLDLAALP
ncbi:MAG TPA: Hpt domain-containing protein [Gemmatimonadaceae bacterium]|nr:Hpt domain-containing protein [Gemmatimonadaceae bacterium]